MLTQEEFNSYCQARALSGAARRAIEAIRGAPPARRTTSTSVSVACRFASNKMKLSLQAESYKNELPALYLWEHDPNVLEVWDQPPALTIRSTTRSGARRSYLKRFDYFLIEKNWAGWVECKKEDWLQAHAAGKGPQYVKDKDGAWRHPIFERHAAEFGLEFRVRSSSETNWRLVRNISLLADYLIDSAPEPDPKEAAKALALLRERPWMTLREMTDPGHGTSADTIFALIVREQIHFDLHDEVLAEPERAHLFRDASVASAHRHLLREPGAHTDQTPGFELRPRAAVTWQGRPWQILNAGDLTVSLTDGSVIVDIPRVEFDTRLGHDIVGHVSKLDRENEKLAIEIMKRASPEDLDDASNKFNWLFPRPGDAPCPKSARSQSNWRRRYREALARHGNGFLGLIHARHKRGNRDRRFPQAVLDIMTSVIRDRLLQPNAPTRLACYGEVRLRCKESKLPAPSERSFRAEIGRLPKHEHDLLRQGEKAAYDSEKWYWELEPTTPRHGDRPFEQGHLDHTQLSLQLVGMRSKDKLGKPWLSLMIDAYTRTILAYHITFEPPSYRTNACLIRSCVHRWGRVPKKLVVDGGADFRSAAFEQLLARIESHKIERPKSKARFGTLIERTFGMNEQELINQLQGNNQALKNPRRMSKSHDPRELAVWDLARLDELFSTYCDWRNASYEHSALNMTANAALAAGIRLFGERSHRHIPYNDAFIIATLPTPKNPQAKVVPGRGVKINGIHYWCEEFGTAAVEGTSVDVWYDPFDISTAYAWLKPTARKPGRRVLLRSQHASVFEGLSERELRIASTEARARLARTGERRSANAEEIARVLRDTVQPPRLADATRKRTEIALKRNQPPSRPSFAKRRKALPAGKQAVPIPGKPNSLRPKMPKRINLPAQRRNTEIAELIAKFERLDIDHAMMQRVIDQVLAAVGRCAGPKIVIVAGPTGVGKTTAARRIYVQKRNDYLPLMQADKDLVPVVGLSAVSPLGNSFAWKDFFQRLLRQAFEPTIDRRLMPPRQEAMYEEDLYLESADRFAADPLRRAVENCLKRRGTRTLVIDEAHHIFMAKDPKRLEFQFEALKSLSIETRLTIVLFGTYALLDIVDQSGQLVRRSQVIHFPRYDGEDHAQVNEFRSFLHRLTMQLQLPRQGSLMADADYYFTKSAGCAGILKDWMAKAYEGALSEGRRSIDKNFADTFAIPNRNLCTIIREAELGEDRLADVSLHTLKAMLMPNIFGRPNGGAANDEAPGSTRKVGQRRARRDPVGLDPTGTS